LVALGATYQQHLDAGQAAALRRRVKCQQTLIID
jgi:hypothetical protein